MPTQLKSKPKAAEPAPRTPERQRLADAIAARARCVEHAKAAVAAIDHAKRNSVADRAAIVAAKQEILAAESREADRLIAQARGQPEPEGVTPDEARAAVAALESKISAHESAILHLQEKLSEANRRTADATNKVTERVYDVLRAAPEVRRLYSDLATATRARATYYAVACLLPGADIRPRDIEISDVPDYSVTRLWKNIVKRLSVDADAVLPD